MNRYVAVFFVLFFLFFRTPFALASNPLNKLARGIINIPASLAELPLAYSCSYTKLKERAAKYPLDFITPTVQTPYFYLVKAPVVGIFRFVGRLCVGCYEVVTFPFSLPRYYAPVIEPEFFFDTMPYEFKLYEQGVVCMNRGDYRSAVHRFSETLKLDPANSQALYYRGKAYQSLGKYRESVRDIDASEKLGFRPEMENIPSPDEKY